MRFRTILTFLFISISPSLGSPLLPRSSSPPCTELEIIMNTYGTLEGSLQGAMIFFPRSQFATVTRELLRVIDEGTLNVHELYGLLDECALPGSGGLPSWEEDKKKKGKRAPDSAGVCEALIKVERDVAQVVELTGRVAAAPDLPESLYIESLVDAAEEAGVSVKVVGQVLRGRDGCV
ncbi:hypothetical protein QBC44DRAFT_85888 [Cladorrhinum sp. PSN332]|nr:hypothetical protein QBC44DRAFT_85888 [Cladorrhinum sp. PSN332]